MNSIFFVSPLLVVCLGSIAVLLTGLWVSSHAALLTMAVSSLVVAGGWYASMWGNSPQSAFAGMLVFDSFGLFFALFAIVAAGFAFFMSADSREIRSDRRSEYYSILLALVSGLIFMGFANHFIMIYLAIETVSILSYTLAGFNRERSESVEASLKYVVYGSMASALMVFGMSLLYGTTGQLTLIGLREFFASNSPESVPALLWIGTLLVFAGLGYKISAAPMHMWTPDVYEGAPTPVSAFFSVAPKAAGFALLLRFFITGYSQSLTGQSEAVSEITGQVLGYHVVGPLDWPKFLMLSSIFTMFMGNLAALGQSSVKRILAYSSIAHAGYILMGATTQSREGLVAIMFYLVTYCFMNLGAFWVASKVDDSLGGDQLRHFRGLGSRAPWFAAAMAVFVVSLIGIPPLSGFVAKFYVFKAVIGREMYGFAAAAAVNSVISLYYYAKILRAMYLESAEVSMAKGPSPFDSLSAKVFLAVLVVPTVVLGLYWDPLVQLIESTSFVFVGN
jgi:NADH-quinone oxidoreductase subunit N